MKGSLVATYLFSAFSLEIGAFVRYLEIHHYTKCYVIRRWFFRRRICIPVTYYTKSDPKIVFKYNIGQPDRISGTLLNKTFMIK